MTSDPIAAPETAIVLGSGCSANLGVPTMVNFMDAVFTLLGECARGNRSEFDDLMPEKVLEVIQHFIRDVKGSAAYVRTDLLNIEELYGLAEMRESLGDTSDSGELTAQSAFNRAIYMIAKGAGKEFIENNTFEALAKDINTIKRESQTEEPSSFSTVSRYTNLIAYLSLASYSDQNGLRPAFIQFNWDLALDRALNVLREAEAGECTLGILNRKDYDNSDRKNVIINSQRIICAAMPWLDYSSASRDATSIALERNNSAEEAREQSIKKGQTVREAESAAKIAAEKVRTETFDFMLSPIVLRPHGAINWVRPIQTSQSEDMYHCFKYGGWSAALPLDENEKGPNACIHKMILSTDHNGARKYDSSAECDSMNISPPTWKKNVSQFLGQWRLMRKYLASARRIIFIGYSMPKSDLYFRHFLALALAENNYAPKVYVWNPGIGKLGPVRESYLDIFAPLAREGRLYGIDGYFGDPALYDLNRVFHLARKIELG